MIHVILNKITIYRNLSRSDMMINDSKIKSSKFSNEFIMLVNGLQRSSKPVFTYLRTKGMANIANDQAKNLTHTRKITSPVQKDMTAFEDANIPKMQIIGKIIGGNGSPVYNLENHEDNSTNKSFKSKDDIDLEKKNFLKELSANKIFKKAFEALQRENFKLGIEPEHRFKNGTRKVRDYLELNEEPIYDTVEPIYKTEKQSKSTDDCVAINEKDFKKNKTKKATLNLEKNEIFYIDYKEEDALANDLTENDRLDKNSYIDKPILHSAIPNNDAIITAKDQENDLLHSQALIPVSSLTNVTSEPLQHPIETRLSIINSESPTSNDCLCIHSISDRTVQPTLQPNTIDIITRDLFTSYMQTNRFLASLVAPVENNSNCDDQTEDLPHPKPILKSIATPEISNEMMIIKEIATFDLVCVPFMPKKVKNTRFISSFIKKCCSKVLKAIDVMSKAAKKVIRKIINFFK